MQRQEAWACPLSFRMAMAGGQDGSAIS